MKRLQKLYPGYIQLSFFTHITPVAPQPRNYTLYCAPGFEVSGRGGGGEFRPQKLVVSKLRFDDYIYIRCYMIYI